MIADRKELTRMFVLDGVADDYENLEMINSTVNALAKGCGLSVSPLETLEAVEDLIRTGLVKAYRLSATRPAEEVHGLPPRSEIHICYFWITGIGAKVQAREYPNWPFDENGGLRHDWRLPES